jgi:hypothetical protein
MTQPNVDPGCRSGSLGRRQFWIKVGNIAQSILLIVAASSCGRGGETIWSFEARSPDGAWIATARANQYSGPGNAAILTGVYLQRATRSTGAEPVLTFFNDLPPTKGGIEVRLNWLSPSRLQITLSRKAAVEFQAVRYAGIDISVKDSPN